MFFTELLWKDFSLLLSYALLAKFPKVHSIMLNINNLSDNLLQQFIHFGWCYGHTLVPLKGEPESRSINLTHSLPVIGDIADTVKVMLYVLYGSYVYLRYIVWFPINISLKCHYLCQSLDNQMVLLLLCSVKTEHSRPCAMVPGRSIIMLTFQFSFCY